MGADAGFEAALPPSLSPGVPVGFLTGGTPVRRMRSQTPGFSSRRRSQFTLSDVRHTVEPSDAVMP